MSILFMMAAAAAGATATPPATAEPKKEKMICKAEKFVGSNRTRRICMTETEWRYGKENARDVMNDIGRGGNFQQPQGPNN